MMVQEIISPNLSGNAYKYSFAILKKLISKCVGVEENIIKHKNQLNYFKSYFEYVDAKTLVVESFYIDRDFLEDYAAYYVRCLPDKYKSYCLRLHFFKEVIFNQDELRKVILKQENDSITEKILQDKYLGFIVIKPLPETFIGRTCLGCYDNDNGRRHYPVIRDYDAHLETVATKQSIFK